MTPSQERRRRSKKLLDSEEGNFHSYRVDKHSFTIYVGGDPDVEDYDVTGMEPGVEHRMADRFEINLSLLSGIDDKKPILVHMASCGGLWEEGMQMFGAILTCPNPVTVLGTKWCRSMSSIIPLAADRFVMRPPARYMYHHGYYGFEGTSQEADTTDLERRLATEKMMRIYCARLQSQGRFKGWDFDRIRTELDSRLLQEIDVWFDADEAVEWGFTDGVYDGDHNKLRAGRKNLVRRKRMMEILRQRLKAQVTIVAA